ncbi:PA1136 family autoinducer-binding transcriptional regulator [Bradyrhizobium sp. NAS80.1]|uniref:PA1136 family autoinducer-binding transcriptional regulator n=1 Tax=Bradyrhizobium sp. NAS80.1 TaxID=1680159 RepID=UPI000A04873A|nr:PA1136 family autoinducer-binding transcriptional regulator [Bradyrhizobium sp. NAS80.1]
MLMPNVPEAMFHALARIDSAESVEAVGAAFKAFANLFGYDRYIVCSASTFTDDMIEEIYLVEGDWTDGQDVDRDTYLLHCPITRHLLSTDHPFIWSKSHAGDDGKPKYWIVRSGCRFGEVNGIQIPVFGRSGLEGAISLAGRTIDVHREAILAARVVAETAYWRLRHILYPSITEHAKGVLTPREREVLSLTALGKRQSEIAVILSVSERTVENTLRAARLRLGTTTTAHAIVTAVKNREIKA